MAQVVIAQKNGLMQFVKRYKRRKFNLWRKFARFTPWFDEARECFQAEAQDLQRYLEETKSMRSYTADVMLGGFSPDWDKDVDLPLYRYYIVVRATKYLHRTRYYSYEHEFFSKKFHRRMSKPVFVGDINKAEFIKSRKYADEVATRCRQTGTEMVAVREVYVYRPNELLQKNIVVVLRHKENKQMKPQFLRTYDRKDGGFTKTSRYDQALHFTYDEYLDLYDEFQALHKEYMVLPKITNNGKPWSGKAKDVDGQESVEGTLRLRNE